ncbi:MAG: glycosyltransferase family 9 protein [Herpetosiphonaceae bacterium]|nr:glycosyltransferase family 9 protein [Herpetosiphonaceae bacterium]
MINKRVVFKSWLVSVSTQLLGHFRARPPCIPPSPARILILKPCCLGDVLLTTPLVHALRHHYPRAHLTYGVGQWSRPMVATSRDLDAIWPIPERWTLGTLMASVRALRQRRFDMVFVPDRSPLLSGLVALAGIPVRIGLDSAGRGWGYTHPVPVVTSVIHEADLYSMLGHPVGVMQIPRQLHFYVPAEAEAEATTLRASLSTGKAAGPFVVLHPGGGANPGMTLHRKRWLPERWAIIADRLIQEHAAIVVLVGASSDQAAIDAVSAQMHMDAAVWVKQWHWPVLGGLIKSADLFLGHDTGMMHLACAVGTPTIAIFGPSDPQMYGPYSPIGTFAWSPTPSSPCFENGTAPVNCPCADQCMRNVGADTVWAKIEKMLERRNWLV